MKLRPHGIQGSPTSPGQQTNLKDGLVRRRSVFTVASNLLKCSLNGEEEIRTLLIDLDL